MFCLQICLPETRKNIGGLGTFYYFQSLVLMVESGTEFVQDLPGRMTHPDNG